VTPETLEAWTIESLRALLEQGGSRPIGFEWKEMLPRDADGKDACAS